MMMMGFAPHLFRKENFECFKTKVDLLAELKLSLEEKIQHQKEVIQNDLDWRLDTTLLFLKKQALKPFLSKLVN